MSYELHGAGEGDIGIFTFGSFTNPGRSAPSYAFMQTCLRVQEQNPTPFDIAYFVAATNDWYQTGIRGLGKDLASSAAALQLLVGRYQRTIFVGNSMGGYAALVFGVLVGAHRVLAFSPQTHLDASFRTCIADTRWGEAMAVLQKNGDAEAAAVARIYAKAKHRPISDIYAGADCPQDVAYAEAVRGLAGVRAHLVAGSGHDLVHDLRTTGELDRLILTALNDMIASTDEITT